MTEFLEGGDKGKAWTMGKADSLPQSCCSLWGLAGASMSWFLTTLLPCPLGSPWEWEPGFLASSFFEGAGPSAVPPLPGMGPQIPACARAPELLPDPAAGSLAVPQTHPNLDFRPLLRART